LVTHFRPSRYINKHSREAKGSSQNTKYEGRKFDKKIKDGGIKWDGYGDRFWKGGEGREGEGGGGVSMWLPLAVRGRGGAWNTDSPVHPGALAEELIRH